MDNIPLVNSTKEDEGLETYPKSNHQYSSSQDPPPYEMVQAARLNNGSGQLIIQQPTITLNSNLLYNSTATPVAANCPRGLEYLTMIDHLLVHQKLELLEIICGWKPNNEYSMKNRLGQAVYTAIEDTNCLVRNCCGPIRPFEMKILDVFQSEVMHLSRPLRCDSCLCPCFLQVIEVFSPPGMLIGTVEQCWTIFKSNFKIKNAFGETVLKINGPCCTTSFCCNDIEFKIVNLDGQQVGRLSKHWAGLAQEIFSNADNFGISFPVDLDVKIKAVLMGACILIDSMFYEKNHSIFATPFMKVLECLK